MRKITIKVTEDEVDHGGHQVYTKPTDGGLLQTQAALSSTEHCINMLTPMEAVGLNSDLIELLKRWNAMDGTAPN